MSDRKKLTIIPATWEDFGGVTPTPDYNDMLTKNIKGEAWLNPEKKPVTLEEKFRDIISPIKGFQEPENISFRTPEDYTRDAIKERNLPFGQRANAFITDQLLKRNLQSSGIGEVAKEIGTPIVSGLMRTKQAGETGDIGGGALGLAGATFGTLMSPFTAIKMGTEKVAGETAGKVAEVGTLALSGGGLLEGASLVAGYFASQGATELATKVAEGLELTPKETETVQEVAGLTAFILGDKSARSFGKKINTELGKKVKAWLDKEMPNQNYEGVFRKREGGEGAISDIFKDVGKTEGKGKTLPKDPRAELERKLDREKISPIEARVKKAKDKGEPINLAIFNKDLGIKDKGLQQHYEDLYKEAIKHNEQLKNKIETKPIESLLEETTKLTEEPVSKREQQKQTVYDENKKIINQILDENKGLLTEREISSRLNTLIEQGKLKKKVTTDSIKKIKQEWKDAQPKPEKQTIKGTPNELGLKIPNEYNDNTVFNYGKNAPVKLRDYVNEHPEVIEKIKDLKTFEEVSDVLRKDWNERSQGVLSGKKTEAKTEPIENVEKIDKNAPAKDLLEKTTKETEPEISWRDLLSKRRTTEEIKRDIEKASREGLNNVGSVLGAVNTKLINLYKELALNKFEEGRKTFESWSAEMIKTAGDNIRPHLRKLYDDLVTNVKINDQPVKDWINKYKGNLNLELKEIDGKIIDPNTGKEGAARHKAGRDKSTIEFNSNTQGDSWYHELAHVINNKIRQIQPNFLEEFKGEIDKLAPSNKPLNEKFADAFTRIYTDPTAPRTRLANVLEKQFDDLPKSYELAERTNKELGFEKLPEREAGVREEKSLDWLETKYDAPKEVVDKLFELTKSDLYKELRQDGKQSFDEAVKQAARLEDITEERLLNSYFPEDYVFNKAKQVKIRQITINKAINTIELEKSFGKDLSTEQAQILDKAYTDLIKLQALAKNNVREAARISESERSMHTMSPEEYQLINKLHAKLKSKFDKSGKTEEQLVKELEDGLSPTIKDYLNYLWYNVKLISPLTHVRNTVGNISSAAYVMMAHPLTGAQAFSKSFKIGMKDGKPDFIGDSWQNAKKVITGEQKTISKYSDVKDKYFEILETKTKKGTIAKNLLLPLELLKAEDAFARPFFENVAELRSAKNLAKKLGVDKKEVLDTYDKLIKNKDAQNNLLKQYSSEQFLNEVAGIERWATKMVFQEPLGNVGMRAQGLLNAIYPINLAIAPFLRIAVNLGKMSLDASPYGLAKILGRKMKQALNFDVKDMTKFEQQDLFRRALIGTSFYASLAALLETETVVINGDAPRRKDVRELWEAAGNRENSIQIKLPDGGVKTIPFDNWTPFNTLLGAIGTMMVRAKYDKPEKDSPIDEKILDGVVGMYSALGNQSFLQGTTAFLTAVKDGDGGAIEKGLVGILPLPNIKAYYAGSPEFENDLFDVGNANKLYKAETILQKIAGNLGYYGGMLTRPDFKGDDAKGVYRGLPFPKTEEVNKVAKFMLDKGLTIGDPDNPKEMDKTIFNDVEFDTYNKLYRRNFYAMMNKNLEYLNELSKIDKYGIDIIQKVITGFKQQANQLAKQSVKEKR